MKFAPQDFVREVQNRDVPEKDAEALCEYVIAYVKQLPFKVKTACLTKLDQALNEMSYDTFYAIENSYHRFFLEPEKTDLKSFVSFPGA